MKHIKFENQVMEMLLAGDHLILALLRNQYANSSIKSREFSEIGFFTHFLVNPLAAAVEPRDFEISDLSGSIGEIKIMLVLFVRDGYLSMLEGIIFGTDWPKEYSNVILKFSSTNGKRGITRWFALEDLRL